jgi:hypothetical protein
MPREEASAPIAITPAARKNVEQEMRRNRDAENARFEVIELSLYWLCMDKAREIWRRTLQAG